MTMQPSPSSSPEKPWQNRRLLAVIIGVAILGGAGAFWWRQQQLQQQIAQQEAAKPLPVQVQVAALGRVEPVGGVINVAASADGIVSRLLVKAGDRVTQGQVLGYLDVYDVRKAERDFAESQLIEAEQALTAQVNLNEAQVQEAGTRIDQIDSPEAESVRSQAAAIGDLQAQLNLAQLDLSRFQALESRGAIAQQQLDSQVATVAQLQQKITAAEAQLAQLNSARTANINNATAQVNTAEANVQLSQATAGVQSAEKNLALAEAQLEQTVLRAPSAGQVIEIFVDPGESTSGASGRQAILSLGNTDIMQVVAEVYETDVGLVEVGQKATIRSRNGAFDQELTGTVKEIALQIFKNNVLDDDPAANADARIVEVDITVDQPEVIDSLTNLQVDVVIEVDQANSKKIAPDT